MKMRKYTIGMVVCALQVFVIFNAHSHSRNQLTHQDSDYFVRPIAEETTTGLIYSGWYQYPEHPDNWKWIALSGEYSIRYQGKILIYRYCSDFQHKGNPKHHYRSSGGRLTLTRESRRIYTHRFPLRPLCSCYRCMAPRWKKLSVRSGNIQYVIYYSGHAEIHKDEKTEHRAKPKMNTKPKRKIKQLEQHSRKRFRTKNAQSEPRNRKEERRRPRCGVSSHNQ